MTFPTVPLGSQFSHPQLEDDAGMHGAVDSQLNALRTASATFGAGLTVFCAAQRAAAVLVSGAPVVFDTQVELTGGGSYNGSTGAFTVPGPGLFLVRFQLRQSTVISFTAELGGLPAPYAAVRVRSAACTGAVGHGPTIPLVPIWCAGGEQLTVIPTFGGSVSLEAAAAAPERSFFSVAQVC